MQNPGVGKRFTFYCDEAGNSGLNYLDLAQPLHVVAGWIVPADAELSSVRVDAREFPPARFIELPLEP